MRGDHPPHGHRTRPRLVSPSSGGFAIVPGADHVDLYDRKNLIPFDRLDEFFAKSLA
ncbi:hypothetical protein OIE52_01230 [Streptomyces canus]|uniref:hypothetical protein n=1 Tax=Streptomyces canus TaxID=58343 RepID=UPI002E29715E|nr:hypothetical protein [Streptomyces canus]